MAVVTKEWIESGAVGADAITLENNSYFKGRNAADSANINIVKVNASDVIEFASVPQVSADPSVNNALTRKSYVVGLLGSYQATSEKNQNSGYCGLDANGKVSSSQLPSYVDDVIEAADLTAIQALTGETGKIYVAIDTGKTYRWSGTVYTQIASGDVNSVNTKTGVITLVTDDIAEDGTPVNLWFTDARAKSAAVSDSITDGVTDVAPSQNAVYDALASKVSTSTNVNGHALSGNVTVTKSDVSLGNVDNVQQLPMSYLDTDNTLAANSDSKVASQKAIKSYVDTAIGAVQGAAANEEIFTLVAGDITNGYVDLAFVALAGSVTVFPKGGPVQVLTDDYTISYTGGTGSKTRITFAGDLSAKLVAGKKLIVKYLKD